MSEAEKRSSDNDRSEISDKTIPIYPLSPQVIKKSDIEKYKQIQPYLDVLKDVLDHKGIYNIAISGMYGSGKSTIIKTFQSENEEHYKFLNIQLSTFKNFKNREDIEISTTENEVQPASTNDTTKIEDMKSFIELNILQEILYQEPASELPDSRFDRIYVTKSLNIGEVRKCFLFLGVISIFSLTSHTLAEWKLWGNIGKFLIFGINTVIRGLILFGCYRLSVPIYEILKKCKVNKFKFGVSGHTIEAENKNKGNILNNNLEEIIYFFSKTKYNVVFIEDLDRSNYSGDKQDGIDTIEIFNILKNINTMLNSTKIIKKTPIKFVYAIKDDLFTDAEARVKFFDYIISVMPFVNSYNAHEQFYELLKVDESKNEFRYFINQVSRRIKKINMRILINIVNEYKLHDKILAKKHLVYFNMFAMVVYKNLYPDDYRKLQQGKGELWHLLEGDNNTDNDNKWKINEDKLIDFFVKNKYIEKESYRKYISIVHSVPEADIEYINAVEGKKTDEVSWQISLSNYEYTCDQLNEIIRYNKYYKGLLNYAFINYILSDRYQNEELCYKFLFFDELFEDIAENLNQDYYFDFVKSFINHESYRNSGIVLLIKIFNVIDANGKYIAIEKLENSTRLKELISQDILISLLRSELNQESKKELIRYSSLKITDIDSIGSYSENDTKFSSYVENIEDSCDIINTLFEHNKIEATYDNIYKAFSIEEINNKNEILMDFLKKNSTILHKQSIGWKEEDNQTTAMFDLLIDSDNFKDLSVWKNLLTCTSTVHYSEYYQFDDDSIQNKEKIKIILENSAGIIWFNQSWYQGIKSLQDNELLKILFIKRSIGTKIIEFALEDLNMMLNLNNENDIIIDNKVHIFSKILTLAHVKQEESLFLNIMAIVSSLDIVKLSNLKFKDPALLFKLLKSDEDWGQDSQDRKIKLLLANLELIDNQYKQELIEGFSTFKDRNWVKLLNNTHRRSIPLEFNNSIDTQELITNLHKANLINVKLQQDKIYEIKGEKLVVKIQK